MQMRVTEMSELTPFCPLNVLCGLTGQEKPLEEDKSTHSSILACRTPWTEDPGGLQFTGSQRVKHTWNNLACMQGMQGKLFIVMKRQRNLNVCTTNNRTSKWIKPNLTKRRNRGVYNDVKGRESNTCFSIIEQANKKSVGIHNLGADSR